MKLYEWKVKVIMDGIDFSECHFDTVSLECYKYKYKYHIVTLENRTVYNKILNEECIPSEIYLISKHEITLVKTRHNISSALKFYIQDEEYYLIDLSTNETVKISLVKKHNILEQVINVFGKEYKIRDFLTIIGKNRVSILPFYGCWNWNLGKPCLFCDFCAKLKDEECVLPSTNMLSGDIRKWWEDKKEIVKEGIKLSLLALRKHKNFKDDCHIVFISGGLPDNKVLWEIIIEVLKHVEINKLFPSANIMLNVPPHNTKLELESIKTLGITTLQYNIEVFGEKIYKFYCPGKLEYVVILEKLQEAVSIFGRGFVRSNIVFGLQPTQRTKEGIIELSNLGIVIDYSIFQPKPGTKLANKQPPKQEDILDITRFLSEIYRKYNFYPIFDRYSSRSSIINEVYECGQ